MRHFNKPRLKRVKPIDFCDWAQWVFTLSCVCLSKRFHSFIPSKLHLHMSHQTTRNYNLCVLSFRVSCIGLLVSHSHNRAFIFSRKSARDTFAQTRKTHKSQSRIFKFVAIRKSYASVKSIWKPKWAAGFIWYTRKLEVIYMQNSCNLKFNVVYV